MLPSFGFLIKMHYFSASETLATCTIMLPNLTDLCSKVIDEIVAHERAEVESETNALLGLSWDVCLLHSGSWQH